MDFEVSLTKIFSKTLFKSYGLTNQSYNCELVGFNNNSFIIKPFETDVAIKHNDYGIIEFIAMNYYLNSKEGSEHLCGVTIEINKKESFYRNYYSIKTTLKLNDDMIEYCLYDPLIIQWFDEEYNKFVRSQESYKTINIENESFIPNDGVYNISTDNPKIKLFDYQKKTLKKMINIEQKISNKSSCNIIHNVKFGNNIYVVNPINSMINSNENKFIKTTTSGGILADVMGLGKTITTISLIKANTNKNPEYLNVKYNDDNRILTNCSLIICPNHLSKQWESEAKKAFKGLKVIKFNTKRDHDKYSYNDIIDSDILIVTQQFLMNFKHYPCIYYQRVTPASISLDERYNYIKNNHLNTLKNTFTNDNMIYKNTFNPLLEGFSFERVIIDEGHEIFGGLANNNQSLSDYISKLLGYMKGKHYWFVSGTPFSNDLGFINAMKFIKMKVNIDNTEYDYNYETMNCFEFLKNNPMKKRIIKDFIVRHRKDDILEEVELLGYDETIIRVDQTDMEKSLYQSKVGKTSRSVLQQLCCHPLIAETFSRFIGNKEVDLDSMKDQIMEHNENIIKTYSHKLTLLDPLSQQYHMLKATYSKKVSEAKYLLSIMKKMGEDKNIQEENCSICFDTLEEPTLTPCGHLFCSDCLKMCLEAKPSCPMCKADLKGKELLLVNKKVEEKKENKNPLSEKYGAKLGKLISVIRYLTSNEDNRIIVFSQWDNMLSLLSKTLSENGVGNSIVKGNIWARNSAISKFKNGVNKLGGDNKVIMLSLNNAASGTNLTEATHIFFIEPIDADKKEVLAIEGQAIGRACRLGQKQKVNIVRVITNNTIEEEIFNKNYSTNTFIPVEEVINQPVELDV